MQTICTGEIFWEGSTAAVTIAGVARLLAHVRRGRLPSTGAAVAAAVHAVAWATLPPLPRGVGR
ncbi:MAG TPA: hypothetical protein VF192_05020 [Longimicrobiales bacterium]